MDIKEIKIKLKAKGWDLKAWFNSATFEDEFFRDLNGIINARNTKQHKQGGRQV